MEARLLIIKIEKSCTVVYTTDISSDKKEERMGEY